MKVTPYKPRSLSSWRASCNRSWAYLLDVDREFGHSGLDQACLVIGNLAKGLDRNDTLGLQRMINVRSYIADTLHSRRAR